MKIRELFNEETKWTQLARARNESDEATNSTDKKAVKWCLLGAAEYCYGDYCEFKEVIYKMAHTINSKITHPLCLSGVVTTWNDNSNYQAVKALVEQLDV